jgi:hypothetical protein
MLHAAPENDRDGRTRQQQADADAGGIDADQRAAPARILRGADGGGQCGAEDEGNRRRNAANGSQCQESGEIARRSRQQQDQNARGKAHEKGSGCAPSLGRPCRSQRAHDVTCADRRVQRARFDIGPPQIRAHRRQQQGVGKTGEPQGDGRTGGKPYRNDDLTPEVVDP